MSTDLKFSLITTLIVLGVIVAGGLTVLCTDFLSSEGGRLLYSIPL